MNRFTMALGLLSTLLSSCGSTLSDPDPVATAVASPHRSTENRARDPFRHPAETLAFFGFDVIYLFSDTAGLRTAVSAEICVAHLVNIHAGTRLI